MKSFLFATAFIATAFVSAYGLYYIFLLALLLIPVAVMAAGTILVWMAFMEDKHVKHDVDHKAQQDQVRQTLYFTPATVWDEDYINYLPQAPRVLIVDDDIDAAEFIDRAFRNFGCHTDISTTVVDAKTRMSRDDIDIIVLDWRLSDREQADDLLEDTIEQLRERRKAGKKIPRVVTYSGLSKDEIDFPESPYFEHSGHWQKPFQYNEAKAKTEKLLQVAGF